MRSAGNDTESARAQGWNGDIAGQNHEMFPVSLTCSQSVPTLVPSCMPLKQTMFPVFSVSLRAHVRYSSALSFLKVLSRYWEQWEHWEQAELINNLQRSQSWSATGNTGHGKLEQLC